MTRAPEVKTEMDVLVDLDSLLDTRLTTLYDMSVPVYEDMIAKGTYHNRYKDSFGPITYSIFKAIYGERTKEILRLATPTNMVNTINEYFVEAFMNNKRAGGTDIPNLYINIYPYKLTDDEQLLIRTSFTTMIKNIPIFIVSMDATQLTPMWVRDNIGLLVLYNGMEWMEKQTANLNLIKTPLVNTAMFVPAVAVSDAHVKNNDMKALGELFTDLEEMGKTLIRVKFLRISNYNSILK